MGMNIAEKILAKAAGAARVVPGEIAVVEVGTCVLTDMNFLPASWREILKMRDSTRVVVVLDHLVPANDPLSAAAHATAREFARRFGITRFHDVGRDQGISHVVVADNAYALPGTVMVNPDSHTCGGGAFNCAARGVGLPETIFAVTTGKSWFRVGETIRYDLEGRLKPGVSAKDVFLHIAGTWGAHVNQNVEYGGPGMANLSLNARRTLAIMGTELSAEFVIFEPDEPMLDYVRARNPAPFEATPPDPDAVYKERRRLALDAIEPLVALPDSIVRNSVPVGEVVGKKIDQAFIGSCANGTLDDLAVAAKVVAGRRVASGVRLIVTPGSHAIYRDALAAGYVATLAEAGAVVTSATCGACVGGHMGVLGPGEVCITASTRNFKGRMGDPTARIYMASPATVAASALAGRIASAAEFFTGDLE
jgi:3-isopropylmalate/(R)-2-methylmalate dehydratase large subunit